VTDTHPDLQPLRERLDTIDEELVSLLASRAEVIHGVVAYKRARKMPVVDRAREDRMLERIGALAEARGLDARVARQVLRAVIDAFTLLEVEELGPDA
jgi:chorismate mutase